MARTRTALYAGSFDPMTLGHEDIIRRAAELFDTLVVGIGINPDKQPLFTSEEREKILREVLSDLDNVRIVSFKELTVDFARSQGASVMIRGVRTVSDIEAEFTMALANHIMAPELETVFLMASERFSHISSTLIKQIAGMGTVETAEEQLRKFVPGCVVSPLLNKLGKKLHSNAV